MPPGRSRKQRRIVWVGESSYPSPELVALLTAGVLPRRGRALEVGCGIASDALLLASLGFETHAVDADPRQVAAARRRASRLRVPLSVVEADATRLPFPARHFDVVLDRLLWNNVVEDGQIVPYLDELARVTKPRARVFVRAKTSTWWTIAHAFEKASRNDLGGGRTRRRIDAHFTLPRAPLRAMLLDPFGGLIPAVSAMLVRKGR